MTSLLPPAAVTTGTTPPLLFLSSFSFLHHIWRWGRGVRHPILGLAFAVQSHWIYDHHVDVVWGADLGPRDGHLAVRVLQGHVDVWHGRRGKQGALWRKEREQLTVEKERKKERRRRWRVKIRWEEGRDGRMETEEWRRRGGRGGGEHLTKNDAFKGKYKQQKHFLLFVLKVSCWVRHF